jgi:hypothetical protein
MLTETDPTEAAAGTSTIHDAAGGQLVRRVEGSQRQRDEGLTLIRDRRPRPRAPFGVNRPTLMRGELTPIVGASRIQDIADAFDPRRRQLARSSGRPVRKGTENASTRIRLGRTSGSMVSDAGRVLVMRTAYRQL